MLPRTEWRSWWLDWWLESKTESKLWTMQEEFCCRSGPTTKRWWWSGTRVRKKAPAWWDACSLLILTIYSLHCPSAADQLSFVDPSDEAFVLWLLHCHTEAPQKECAKVDAATGAPTTRKHKKTGLHVSSLLGMEKFAEMLDTIVEARVDMGCR